MASQMIRLDDSEERDARLEGGNPTHLVDAALQVAREQLDMDVAVVAELTASEEIFRRVDGDADGFGLVEGESIPRGVSYCQRVLDGRIPSAIHDARNDPRVKTLEITGKGSIGAYLGVPLVFSDGRVYGMLCCLSHDAQPSVGERDVKFMRILARMVADQLEREELENEKRKLELEATGVHALLVALEARDGYTGNHSRAVVELSTAIARHFELPERDVGHVEQVALLHDIGKIGIPDAILRKEGPLDATEWEAMYQHPVIGATIVSSIPGLLHLGPAIRAEHERWDGAGYPDGLTGDDIPLEARIVFAADAYHAMISDRPYRKGMTILRALHELEENAGTQFCPRIVASLQRVLPVLGTEHATDPDGKSHRHLRLAEMNGGRVNGAVR